MDSFGKAAHDMISEVRRQFKENPGIMQGGRRRRRRGGIRKEDGGGKYGRVVGVFGGWGRVL